MSCKRYNKLLHLNHHGEINSRQEKKLQRHLKLCPKCNNEKLQIEKADQFIKLARKAKSLSPIMPDLAGQIIGSIQIEQKKKKYKQPQHFFKHGFGWLVVPTVRYFLVGSALFIFGILLYHTHFMLASISRLENRMVDYSQRKIFIESRYSKEDILRQIVNTVEEEGFLNDKNTGINMINKKTIFYLVLMIRTLDGNNLRSLKRLADKFLLAGQLPINKKDGEIFKKFLKIQKRIKQI